MDRLTALEVLGLHRYGLDQDVDLPLLKRRFRALAREQHPDRGGDPDAFHDLHAAYELLLAELAAEEGRTAGRVTPRVARGRPSREDDAGTLNRRLDAEVPDGRTLALARELAATGTWRRLSRAPGARTNRFAASLAVGSTSSLGLVIERGGPGPTPDGTVRVRIELVGRGRAARRALAALDPASAGGAAWSRRRGDAITVVEAAVTGTDRDMVAHRAAVATARLLAALAWPLVEWHEG